MTPTDQRDIPYHMMLCLATKAQGKEEEGGTFMVMVFAFPSNCWLHMLRPHFPGSGWTSVVNALFALLACAAFAFLVKLSLSQPTNLLFFLLFSLHSMEEGSEQDAGWVLAAGQG